MTHTPTYVPYTDRFSIKGIKRQQTHVDIAFGASTRFIGLKLTPEPDNQHDAKAIKVMAEIEHLTLFRFFKFKWLKRFKWFNGHDSLHIGYLPRDVSFTLYHQDIVSRVKPELIAVGVIAVYSEKNTDITNDIQIKLMGPRPLFTEEVEKQLERAITL